MPSILPENANIIVYTTCFNARADHEDIPIAKFLSNCSKGTKSYKNGSTYVGPIKNGLAHGKGTTTFKCGDIYVGTFVNDKRTGKAEYTWKGSGNYYVGSFLKGKLHGKGTVT